MWILACLSGKYSLCSRPSAQAISMSALFWRNPAPMPMPCGVSLVPLHR